QLPQPQTEEGHQHIAGKYPSPLMGFGLLVQPAFQHHVLAHHGHAHQPAQYQPDLNAGGQRVAEHGGGDHSGAGDEGANVPDPGNQPVPDRGAHDQPNVIGGHQDTDPDFAHIGGGQAKSEVGTEQPAAEQHEE